MSQEWNAGRDNNIKLGTEPLKVWSSTVIWQQN